MRWFTSVTLTAYFGGVAPQVRSHRSSFRTRTQVAWLKTMPRVLSGCPLAFLFSWSAFSFFWGLFTVKMAVWGFGSDVTMFFVRFYSYFRKK